MVNARVVVPSDLAKSSTQNSSRRHRHDVSTYNGKLKSAWRQHIPFYIWLILLSIYCCILCLNARVYRTNRQQAVSFNNDEPQYSASGVQSSRSLVGERQAEGAELVHVVITRFMQNQSALLDLGLARLALFQAFCLPSMLAQTNSNFIWVIRTDPKLHNQLVTKMQELLKGRQNFILLGSNNNPEGFGRDQEPIESFLQADKINGISAPIWSGNITLLEEAYKLSAAAGSVLLETRLDSDDALHAQFVETVQADARNNLFSHPVDKNDLWRLWCIDSKIEFHPFNPFPKNLSSNSTTPPAEGYLVLFSEKICVTPGLTFGYGAGTNRESLGVGRLRHDQIAKKIKKCEATDKTKCVSRVSLLPGALRARTTTSAGMSHVITGNEDIDKDNGFRRKAKDKVFIKQFYHQHELWNALSSLFAIPRRNAQLARSVIIEHMAGIAQDNLKGQCTSGHSCKNSTKKVLENYLQQK
jgi:hypothetical protein